MKRKKLKAVKTVIEMNIEENRERGRTKKWWLDAMKSDIRTEDMHVNDDDQ